MEIIVGRQNVDLYKIWAKDFQKIDFLLKRMTNSVARSWGFFPAQFWDFLGGSFGLATLMTASEAADGCGRGRLHRRANEWREQMP